MDEHSNPDRKSLTKTLLDSLSIGAGVCIIMILYMHIFYWLTASDRQNPITKELLGGKFVETILVPVFLPLCRIFIKISAIELENFERDFLEHGPSVRMKEKLACILRRPEFYITYTITALVYLTLPLGWSFPPLAGLLTSGKVLVMNEWLLKLLLLAVLFLIVLSAFLGACNVWQRDKIEHPNRKRSTSDLSEMFLVGIIPWVAGCILFITIFPKITPLARLIPQIFTFKTLIVLAVLVVAYYIFRIVRAFYKRMKFYRSVSSMCKSRGFEITPIVKPFLSVFTMVNGESFRVTANGKTYSCKLIGAMSRSDPLAIYDNGSCSFIHAVRFLKVTWMHFVRSYVYTYDAVGDAEKILIVNPVPKELLTGRDGINVPIDNGFIVGGYHIYAGTAFVNALVRDSVK